MDAWDELHVRLPCSPRNTYRRKSNRDKDLSRWYLIQTSLADGIATSQDLHDAILSYHPKVAATWDFSGVRPPPRPPPASRRPQMHSFFNTIATKDESALFFASLLPRIVQLAFRLPHLCAAPIPLLVRPLAPRPAHTPPDARLGPHRGALAGAGRVAAGQRFSVHLPPPGAPWRELVRRPPPDVDLTLTVRSVARWARRRRTRT